MRTQLSSIKSDIKRLAKIENTDILLMNSFLFSGVFLVISEFVMAINELINI